MGLLDRLLGRSAPPPPGLDQLFAVPDAAITLETAAGFAPTGLGAVCFRAAEGAAFPELQADVEALLQGGRSVGAGQQAPRVKRVQDGYGFTWLVAQHDPGDVPGLVTDLHAVNATLQDAGFGPALLCSLVGFRKTSRGHAQAGTPDDGAAQRLALVYLYKRGTFYPFAPLQGERRDNALELQVRGLLASDLRVEPELNRWFPVWGAPGL